MLRFPSARFVYVWLTLLGLLRYPNTLFAQPWVPAQGEGTVSLTYQNYYTTGHFNNVGKKDTNGATHTKAFAVELDYGVTDTVGLSVTLPFIASKYTGAPSYFVAGRETFPGPLDDGTYHGAFQDVRIEVRRLFQVGPAALTPFLGASFPTHDYDVGEAVPGRKRRELQVGASAGTDLDPVLPAVYVHARYALAVAQRVRGFPAVRSTIDLEGGRAINSRVGLKGLASWQIKHKGPAPPELFEDWENHDRFIVGSFFNLGAATTVALTRSTELSATWLGTVSGKGGGHVARSSAIGLSWSFGGAFEGFGASN